MSTRETIARACIVPLGYPANVDWERTWVGNQCDSIETGSLAYLCRSLADAMLATQGSQAPGGRVRSSFNPTLTWPRGFGPGDGNAEIGDEETEV